MTHPTDPSAAASGYRPGSILGTAVRRVEDPELITGQGTFVANLATPETAHAVLVRSPFAHALITGIDAAEALRKNPTISRSLAARPASWVAAAALSPARAAVCCVVVSIVETAWVTSVTPAASSLLATAISALRDRISPTPATIC